MPLTAATIEQRLLQALPLAPKPAVQGLAAELLAAWGAAGRDYHNLQHLAECLAWFDAARHEASDAAAVTLALLFHDAIYDAQRPDNEARSAAWAVNALRELGAAQSLIAPVRQMVLATQTHRADGDADTALLLDIDLSILGASPERFASYEQGIRAEYAHVPEPDYVQARARVMRAFAARKPLYLTPFFHERLHGAASRNLARWA